MPGQASYCPPRSATSKPEVRRAIAAAAARAAPATRRATARCLGVRPTLAARESPRAWARSPPPRWRRSPAPRRRTEAVRGLARQPPNVGLKPRKALRIAAAATAWPGWQAGGVVTAPTSGSCANPALIPAHRAKPPGRRHRPPLLRRPGSGCRLRRLRRWRRPSGRAAVSRWPRGSAEARYVRMLVGAGHGRPSSVSWASWTVARNS